MGQSKSSFEQMLKSSTERKMNQAPDSVSWRRPVLEGGALSARFLQKNNNVSLYPLTALALAACGGGGGGGSSPTPPTPNEPPAAPVIDDISSQTQTLTLNEGTTDYSATDNSDRQTGYTFTATDEDGDTVTFSVNDDRFEIVDGALLVKTGQEFDFRNEPRITLTITATDDSTSALTDTETVEIDITPTVPLTGRVYDGPIVGAKVYFDVNRNGVLDEDDVQVATTDALGEFTISVADLAAYGADTPLLVVLDDATDIGNDLDDASDDIPLTSGTWQAPVGSSVISPLTDFLVKAGLDSEAIAERLGLPEGVDVTQYDPYASGVDDATASEVMTASQEVAQALELLDATDTEVTVDAVVAAIDEVLTNPPTDFTLTSVVAELPEDTDTGTRTKVADLAVEDEDTDSAEQGYILSGDDEDLFEVIGAELYLIAGASLDFETNPSLDVTVTVAGTRPPLRETYTITLTNVDEAPTAFTLENAVAALAQDVDTAAQIKIADLVVEDVDTASADHSYIVTSTNSDNDAALFVVEGAVLYLIAGASLDATNTSLDVTVTVDGTSPSLTQTHSVTVDASDTAPTAFARTSVVASLAENADTSTRMIVANLAVTDADTASADQTYNLTGDDAALFEVEGAVLYLIANAPLDFEANPSLDVTVTVAGTSLTATHRITITDVNEAPVIDDISTQTQSLTLNDGTTPAQLANRETGYSFTATDPDVGDIVSFTVDDDRFSIATTGGNLLVKTNQVFDYETEPRVSVTITATDGDGLTDTEQVIIQITEAPSDTLFNPGVLGTRDFGIDSTPVFGDVDGDGDMDVLIGRSGGGLNFIRWGDNSGTSGSTGWTDQTTALTGNLAALGSDFGSNSAPAFGDIDGDGDTDVLIGFKPIIPSADDLTWALRGTPWVAKPNSDTPPLPAAYSALGANTDTGDRPKPAFGDVDGDGDDDLVIGTADGRLLFFRWGTDNGGSGWAAVTGRDNPFNSGNSLAESGVPASDLLNLAPAFGDVDGDGDDDLLLGRSDGKLSFYRFVDDSVSLTGLQYISSKADEFVDGVLNNPFRRGNDRGDNSAPSFGDVNGDGHDDLLIGEKDGVLNIRYWDDETDTWVGSIDIM